MAHRVKIILDSDYILVMSDGQAAEFDTPQKLIDRGKLFRGLAKVTITISKLMASQGMLLYVRMHFLLYCDKVKIRREDT